MMTMTPYPIRSAVPDQAVPRGRIGYDLEADVLLLHTIQRAAAFEELLTTGRLRPDPLLADPMWPDAYDWMLRMMAARLPTSGDAALWLWAKNPRYELVADCRRARGEVLLTCRIPRERVLLSHYSVWHSALNSSVATPEWPGESDDECRVRWDQIYDEFDASIKAAGVVNTPIRLWPAGLRAEVEQSWECIFDRRLHRRKDPWQATVHELRAEDVVEAVRILT